MQLKKAASMAIGVTYSVPNQIEKTMDLDQLFRGFAASQGRTGTMIACLYTGSHFPSYCAPMPRDPDPQVGIQLDGHFQQHVTTAIQLNPSVHDGAITIGRKSMNDNYQITGWSFRLLAPNYDALSPVNRGSAFNSCFAISQENDIDRVYLHSAGQMHLFLSGAHTLIYEGSSSTK